MGYRVAAGGTSHVFADLRELMAKATLLRSGDQLAGLAAGLVRGTGFRIAPRATSESCQVRMNGIHPNLIFRATSGAARR